MSDPGVVAATDQAHAEAEATLNRLIAWWGEARGRYAAFGRSGEIAALTHILTVSATDYSALLATAIARLAEDFKPPYCNRCGIPHAEGKCGR
jgi:hypothetical protein